jgi:hypothetical protein
MPYKDPEHARANARLRAARYRQTEKGKAARKRGDERYAETHPDQIRERARERTRRYRSRQGPQRYVSSEAVLARAAVRDAVKRGTLLRQPCWCGRAGQAHHPRGYDEEHRLDVEWLCALHHAAAHKAMRVDGVPLPPTDEEKP